MVNLPRAALLWLLAGAVSLSLASTMGNFLQIRLIGRLWFNQQPAAAQSS